MGESVLGPGGDPHRVLGSGGLPPAAIPEDAAVANVFEPLALQQTWRRAVGFFVGRNHLEIRHRFLEVHGIVADYQPQVAGAEAAVVALVVVLAVDPDEHVAPIPQGGPDMYLFASMHLEIGRGTRRNIVAAKAEERGLRPMLEVV